MYIRGFVLSQICHLNLCSRFILTSRFFFIPGIRKVGVEIPKMARGSQNLNSIGLLVILTSLLRVKCNTRTDFEDNSKGYDVSCTNEFPQNVSVTCHGVRIVRQIVQQLLEKSAKQKSVDLFDGVSLVDTEDGRSLRSARFLKESNSLGSLIYLLEGKELRIKLPSILPGNLESALEKSLPVPNQGEFRKKYLSLQ